MEIIYYHKSFSKDCGRPVDRFLFLLAVVLQIEFRSPFSYCDHEFDMETDVPTQTTICG